MNPGLAALWEEEIERRKVKNINVDNIGPPSSPVRTDVQQTASHDFYKNNLEQQLYEYAKEEVHYVKNFLLDNCSDKFEH